MNKSEHKIAASIKEWLVFKNQFLSLDRAKLFFNLIVECSDNHLKADLRRINYLYEEDRDGGGSHYRAEEWITDEYALNKKKTKFYNAQGKFRKKTIDRKDELFEAIFIAVCNVIGGLLCLYVADKECKSQSRRIHGAYSSSPCF